MQAVRISVIALLVFGSGCHSGGQNSDDDVDAATPDGPVVPTCDGTPSECAAMWEQNASDRFDGVLADPTALAAFLKAVPKGGDLHNHLTGAVYAETYLAWAKVDDDCINSSTYSAVYSNQCSASTQPVPVSGSFFDAIVRAWSMKDYTGTDGHGHFFSTFGKYGAIAGAHRDDTLADIAKRAADENQLYIETMFNLGKNVSTLAASVWSQTVTPQNLQAFYDAIMTSPQFASQIAADVAVVTSANAGLRSALGGCAGTSPPAACGVGVRFVAQVSRTGASDAVFGQLVSAFEMAERTGLLVGVNLSSPEDDTSSLTNYDLHMAMLDFLYTKYTATHASPLHVTLHAGEVVPKYLPANSTDNTFHVRHAVEIGHAERIGHGVDVMSETDPEGLLTEMHDKNVMVEVCLSSNLQILEVSGAAHPLATYLAHDVPVALATDDQGVSRSSLAGEYQRAALDQHLTYRQLKTMARQSLEHSFLPGDSLWTSVTTAAPVGACASTATMGIGDPPSAGCAAFLAGSERATIQWELEHRFRLFESAQPAH